MKKLLSLFTVLALLLCTLPAFSLTAAAETDFSVWALSTSGKGGKYSVDTTNYYGDSRSSIKLAHTDEYIYSCVKKTVKVEPLTTYKLSAWVRYTNYNASPDSQGKTGYKGAFLRALYVKDDGKWNSAVSKATASNKWTKLECTVTTVAEQTEMTLQLLNGCLDNECKGTAYFSDIKLEKAELDNEWNILAVTFTNIDANIKIDGKKQHITASIDSEGKKLINNALKTLPSNLKKISGGLMSVDKLKK